MSRYRRGYVRVVMASTSVGDGNPYRFRELPAMFSSGRVSFTGYLLNRRTWQRAGRLASVAPQRVFVVMAKLQGESRWTETGVEVPAWVRIEPVRPAAQPARHLTVNLDSGSVDFDGGR